MIKSADYVKILKMKGIILILTFIISVLYLWYVFAIIYHLIRFGVGVKPKFLALFFFIGSFLLLILAILAYSQVNWEEILKFISDKIKMISL
ncbi:hypothetical protein KJ636_02040 [Patescibacteria group bacterium]|nr:hypothetical protein [Patescibacteria group bacterium]MBU4481076.1 hypothetical protein [Patescibacteria group bacterium]